MDLEKPKIVFAPSRLGWVIIIVIILAIVVIPSYYFYSQYQKTQALLQKPNTSSDLQTKTLLDQVGKLIELPQNEQPTVATVSDITKLSNQPFFVNAKNGDKVLIYAQEKEAILYRPSLNKIINVSQVNIGGTSPSSSLVPSSSPKAPTPSASTTAVPTPTSFGIPIQ